MILLSVIAFIYKDTANREKVQKKNSVDTTFSVIYYEFFTYRNKKKLNTETQSHGEER